MNKVLKDAYKSAKEFGVRVYFQVSFLKATVHKNSDPGLFLLFKKEYHSRFVGNISNLPF